MSEWLVALDFWTTATAVEEEARPLALPPRSCSMRGRARARGRKPGGGYFDPQSVQIDWKHCT